MKGGPSVGRVSPDSPAQPSRPAWRARAVAAARGAAANPASSDAKLWMLCILFGNTRAIAGALAGNPASRGVLLRWVVRRSLRRGHWNVGVIAAQHPACSIRLYRRLLWSPFPAVEAAAAANTRAASLLIDKLDGFAGASLRLFVATNPFAPPDLIDRLLADKDPYVRRVAAAHPAAASASLRRLCRDFSQPAWTLRAAATNPACPADLSDQLLTWLALGAAGPADPHFDPIECSGNPDSTEVNPVGWYANAARQDGAEMHALWRVRAAIPSARARIPIFILTLLAADPRAEVRRQSARFRELPSPVLRELRADADTTAARLAESALKNKPKRRIRLRWARSPRRIAFSVVLIVVAVLVNIHTTPSSSVPPLLGVPSPGASASVEISDGFSVPGTIATTRTVAGGGEIDAGTITGTSSIPELPFVSVTAGTVSLTVTVPGAYTFGPSVRALSGPLTVGANQRTFLVLPADSTWVDVTVLTPGKAPVTLTLEFAVASS
jgi:hypothetical protein